jgi:DNA-binding transcriptional ArsR family regulator
MATTTRERPKARTATPAATAGCCSPVTEAALTEPEAEEYAGWFKVLADPTRVRILSLLARHDEPLCVCHIVDHFSVGQPTISHHLKVLRDARFVVAERRGTFMHYRVNRACLEEFPAAARHILNR